MLLTLPDEILLKILRCVQRLPHFLECTTKRDVLSCRLVCRRLSRIGEDIVFEDIILAPSRSGFQPVLGLSNSSLRHKVKKLRCFFEIFDPQLTTSIDLFTAEIERRNTQQFCSVEILDEDVRQDFEAYQEGFHWQTLLEQSVLDTPVFGRALNRLENLSSISLSQIYTHSIHNEPDIGEDNPSDVIQSPAGHMIFEALVDALVQCGRHIEDLTLGYLDEDRFPSTDDSGLVGIIQRLNPESYPKYRQAFGKLKRLTIVLPWTMGEYEELNYSGLSALIRSAPALECLCLTSECLSLDFLPVDFLLSIRAPNLSTLVLHNAMFQEPTDLLVLLQMHAATLRVLDLSDIILERDSWQTVLFKTRSFLRLQSCTIRDLFVGNDGTGEAICPPEELCQFYQAVEDFVCRKSDENPFQLL
ncbi:hypothetical protein F4824DRAFT_476100 [Ustulina deusta]|nr:hypothetical protein F4824DRAFT_476100 [Ustulina deusta]